MAIYREFSHEKWWFSIVFCMFTRGYHKFSLHNTHDRLEDAGGISHFQTHPSQLESASELSAGTMAVSHSVFKRWDGLRARIIGLLRTCSGKKTGFPGVSGFDFPEIHRLTNQISPMVRVESTMMDGKIPYVLDLSKTRSGHSFGTSRIRPAMPVCTARQTWGTRKKWALTEKRFCTLNMWRFPKMGVPQQSYHPFMDGF